MPSTMEATTGCATRRRYSDSLPSTTDVCSVTVHFTSVCIGPDINVFTLLQLKIAYSVHRDLNVKANNDKSWDYGGGGAVPGAAAGPGPPTNGYNPSATASLAADEPPTGVLAARPLPAVQCAAQHDPLFGMLAQWRQGFFLVPT